MLVDATGLAGPLVDTLESCSSTYEIRRVARGLSVAVLLLVVL